ncbi:hypothetical protein WAX74_13950 [Psychrobacillus sp. FJAT-51614]|uniref:Uncharacterized protein n=1 Tax=Psychrobacillus mangrovi TaxID=3117745 RepID=A0ABU8F9L1_9BACI
MRNGFKQLFIGFLFIFIKIHIIVDLFPDFIGYIFIYNGIKQIATLSSQPYEKLKNLLIILVIVSMPNFFLNDQVIQQSEWLGYYSALLSVLKVSLVYLLFTLLQEVAKLLPYKEGLISTKRMYYWYMSVVLPSLFIQSFLMNTSYDNSLTGSILIVMFILIIEISFLVYLNNMRKRYPKSGIYESYAKGAVS